MTETPAKPKEKSSAIDWREVERRLEAAKAAIERVWEISPDAAARMLEKRTSDLAREAAPAEDAGQSLEVVEFGLAHERYAFELRHVREVCALDSLTPLPCTPDFVLGIVNIRGRMLSVVDLKRFFGLPEKGLTDLDKVVVLESPEMTFGVLADAVAGVRRIPLSDIQPSLPTLTGIREAYLRGVAEGRTVLLDAEKLLADQNLRVQEQVDG
ncbi:MAG: chemotaxis protein CheW [Gammaproteobacteria bacterium]